MDSSKRDAKVDREPVRPLDDLRMEIAAKAGVATGLAYYYFASKEAIVLKAFFRKRRRSRGARRRRGSSRVASGNRRSC